MSTHDRKHEAHESADSDVDTSKELDPREEADIRRQIALEVQEFEQGMEG
ncbi:hypothetical protein FHX49_001616 [Microbacterium endophyticum]|uniref:Uncharacterized protein n=1 Tax=Microbacterium endophyticum TaxID=1526412 RepID=A0A7W4YNU4_9MICO|nr:hypothetical protein [Microbacterium endophyticum]MBB2976046.1 hypothetical protein [Microbacterium endophyticum]NIK35035.1 hypothetical protein [Microbacterium endophyticum]